MFTQSARYYDALYSFKDYRRESQILLDLVSGKEGGTLLDVACGTGKHLECLRTDFDCEGLDLDRELLAIAGDRLPGMPLYHADMTAFNLDKTFDVVTCLFSAIGFAETVDRLNAAMRCISAHTKPDGVVIVEPWLPPEVWDPSRVHALFIDEPDLKIARMSVPSLEGRVSVLRFEYLVATPAGIERISEVHRLGLFTDAEYVASFRDAGLDVHFVEGGLTGRGLYVGRRPKADF